ncbi:MAG: hypothetical protein KJP06_06655 [Deltaproteobacteria bacterium]|nr:hypothetical protein [Deltaproteobacteria bacterium]
MEDGRLHYGWVVIFMRLLTTIAAHDNGRMSDTIIFSAKRIFEAEKET